MNFSQLFYLPNELYTAALGGFAGLLAATAADWMVSASLLREAALIGVLTMIVFVVCLAVGNSFVRLRSGRWPADA